MQLSKCTLEPTPADLVYYVRGSGRSSQQTGEEHKTGTPVYEDTETHTERDNEQTFYREV